MQGALRWVLFNSRSWPSIARGFAARGTGPAEWCPVHFKTRSAGAAAAEPDVTSEQNKEPLEALKSAIDEDYAYSRPAVKALRRDVGAKS